MMITARAFNVWWPVLALCCGSATAAPQFYSLYAEHGVSATAVAISADGTTVLVSSNHLWRPASGMFVSLGASTTELTALAISPDGAVVVGENNDEPDRSGPARWSALCELLLIGDLPGGQLGGRARAASAFGTTIVGVSGAADGNQAFRWTEASGIEGLGYLGSNDCSQWAPYCNHSEACDVSADGTVIVGYGNRIEPGGGAWRWTESEGFLHIGALFYDERPGSPLSISEAHAVSPDGSVVVGFSQGSTTVEQAFRWSAASGMQAVGSSSHGMYSRALDVSETGATIVGWQRYGESTQMYPKQGMIFVSPFGSGRAIDLLQSVFGLSLQGWDLREVTATSDDGLVLVGWGYNPQGIKDAWVAILENATAACCVGDACVAGMDRAGCAAVSGTYFGQVPDCSSLSCTVSGGCLFSCVQAGVSGCTHSLGSLRTCITLAEEECALAGGVFTGEDCACFTACGCPGDVTGDCTTNALDFNILSGRFGFDLAGCADLTGADLNCDGVVNATDFNILASDFGCGG